MIHVKKKKKVELRHFSRPGNPHCIQHRPQMPCNNSSESAYSDRAPPFLMEKRSFGSLGRSSRPGPPRQRTFSLSFATFQIRSESQYWPKKTCVLKTKDMIHIIGNLFTFRIKCTFIAMYSSITSVLFIIALVDISIN